MNTKPKEQVVRLRKLEQSGDEQVLVLDDDMLRALGVGENGQVDISIVDGKLIIRPAASEVAQDKFSEIAEEVASRRTKALRELAK